MLEEELDEDDAALAEGGDFREAQLSLDTAVLPMHEPAVTNENSIPEVGDFLDAAVRSSRFLHPPKPGDQASRP